MVQPTFRNNTDLQRYEYEVNGQVAFASYSIQDNILHIKYVEAPPALRGTGAAGTLMQDVMDTARAAGYKVIPICGYAASWIKRHTEYSDMLA